MNEQASLVGATEPTTAPIHNVFSDRESFNQLVRMATAFSKSQMVPDSYRNRPEDCMVALDMAMRMGVPPLMVMQNLYMVKGKPSWSGQACITMIQSSGKFRGMRHVYFGEEGEEDRGCYVTAVRAEDGEQVDGPKVTIAMAKSEGWSNNPKWKNMPELMLAYRAAAFFARIHCPETLMGVQVEGEAEDSAPEKRTAEDVL